MSVNDHLVDDELQPVTLTVNGSARTVAVPAHRTLLDGLRDEVARGDRPAPMPRFGVSHTDRPVLADGRVNYHGEPVAAVVAETLDAAQAGARAVVVDYRELPGAYTLEAALAPGAHLVQ